MLEAGFLITGSAHTAGAEDLVDGLVDASILFSGGVQGGRVVLARAGDESAVDDLAEGGLGLSGEERHLCGIHVTDQDLRDAAEALVD